MVRIGIIGGAGLLGATTAFCLSARGIADEIVLTDIKQNLAKSHAMDIGQALCETDGAKLLVGELDDLMSCDVVLNVAGVPEMKASSRDDYLSGNIVIVRELAEKIKQWGTSPVILSATNPVDVLNYELFKKTGLPAERFIGFSRNDTLRFKWAVSEETGIPVKRLDALVIGEHGDGQVPLFEHLRDNVSDQLIALSSLQISGIHGRLNSWFRDYQMLDSGRSSGWTSGEGICRIIELIINESDEICPCSVIPFGEYGLNDLSIGLPVRLCRLGVREIVEIDLSMESKAKLMNAADRIRSFR